MLSLPSPTPNSYIDCSPPWHKLSMSIYRFVQSKDYVVCMSYTRTLFDPFRPTSLNESTSTVLIDISVQRVSHVMCVYIYVQKLMAVPCRARHSCMLSWRRVADIHRSHVDSLCPPVTCTRVRVRAIAQANKRRLGPAVVISDEFGFRCCTCMRKRLPCLFATSAARRVFHV